jgi:hypothetical protein
LQQNCCLLILTRQRCFKKMWHIQRQNWTFCTGTPMHYEIIVVHDEKVNPKLRSVHRWSWISPRWITEYAL